MSKSLQMWVEVLFNIGYLVAIWALVIIMIRRRGRLSLTVQGVAVPFIWAFGLLALGDTGHVGFRVVAYALGDLETRVTIFGRQVGLVGLGALSTAVTVTFFYVIILLIWQRRFQKPYGWLGVLLLGAAAIRLVVIMFPQNQWYSMSAPFSWSLYRNIPLMVQGLGAAYLTLRDAYASRDRTFIWVGVMILVSYAFYTPVILFVRQMPVLGMLMIPKTLAYLSIAWLAYKNFFAAKPVPAKSATT